MDIQPSKLALLTGTTKGIGRALLDELLEKNYFVLGIARSEAPIQNENYRHIKADLADFNPAFLEKFLPKKEWEEALLVSNAGLIGDIKPVGEIDSTQIQKVIQVNLTSVMTFTNWFVNEFEKCEHAHVLTISSGAGMRPIDAWSAYCASKAGVNLFKECLKEELTLREMKNWFVHTISPGVIDTDMQAQIRASNPNDFKVHERFMELKETDQLTSPKEVARKLMKIISAPKNYADILIDLRNLED
ncbi:MAG: SDR family NAD(P)-dependent oxidoreductase [Crocinitomicaceae bacterium]|nr:SDR family NAD(P)-dependent oxidoreductase [Crocinitomicaceae bacterium]